MSYDLHGNLTDRTDANSYTTAFEHDARHRRTKSTFADEHFEGRTFRWGGDKLRSIR